MIGSNQSHEQPQKSLSPLLWFTTFVYIFQYLVLEKQLYNSPFPFIACNQHCCDSASFGGHASSQLHMQPSNHHGVYINNRKHQPHITSNDLHTEGQFSVLKEDSYKVFSHNNQG